MPDRSRQKPGDWYKDPRVPDGYKPPPGNPQSDRPRIGGPPRPRPKPPVPQPQTQKPYQPRGIELADTSQAQPRQRQAPSQQWTGEGSPDPYADPQDELRILRGAYEAGLKGDVGAAESFPRGSKAEREYQRGLREREERERNDSYRERQRRGRGLGLTEA